MMLKKKVTYGNVGEFENKQKYNLTSYLTLRLRLRILASHHE